MSRKLDTYDDMQRPKRLQHRDERGLDVLMHDYLGLADELEEPPLPVSTFPVNTSADAPMHDTDIVELVRTPRSTDRPAKAGAGR